MDNVAHSARYERVDRATLRRYLSSIFDGHHAPSVVPVLSVHGVVRSRKQGWPKYTVRVICTST